MYTKRHYSDDEIPNNSTDESVGFVVPQKSGGYLIGLGRTIAHLDFDSGITKVLHEVDEGTNNRFNDGKCDPAGRLWAGNYPSSSNPNPMNSLPVG